MKIGDVLKKEREAKGLNRYKARTTEEMAKDLGVSIKEYAELESGNSPVERWFPLLCEIAVRVKAPTSRLLAKSGKSSDCKPGQAGPLIRGHREEAGLTIEELVGKLNAEKQNVDVKEYVLIEKGDSPIEKYGPLMLHFAELIDQPMFNIFLPCGVHYSKLDDYP